MKCNAERLIEALIHAQMLEYQQAKIAARERAKPPCVVTMSRECGSRGREVGQQLAAALGVRCCDRMILQEVARRAQVEEDLVEALDQHSRNLDEHWWQRFHLKRALTVEEYYVNLLKTVSAIPQSGGGVIIGRGANLILGPQRAFRVRVTSSLQVCANTIADREHLPLEQAIRIAEKTNRERAEYIRKLYDTDINDLNNYDLVLNAERFSNDQMVRLIIDALRMAGFRVPAGATSKLTSSGSCL